METLGRVLVKMHCTHKKYGVRHFRAMPTIGRRKHAFLRVCRQRGEVFVK
jgi:hypothetical protein